MKTVLITTTINVPRVLARYREFGPDVHIIVAGDRKSPHDQISSFLATLGDARYLSDTDQERLGYESSEIIGWNKIMRRNLALLEAIRAGAEMIVTVDDDNIPLDADYFKTMQKLFAGRFDGVSLSSGVGWINAGDFLEPPVYHRGFPYEYRHTDLDLRLNVVSGIEIGVVAGLWLGDPDINAMERLTNRPNVTSLSELGRRGFVVEPGNWTPFNSQNTAFRGELAPLMLFQVGIGRYEDIWASFIAQRAMRQSGQAVYFGPPLVYQERNEQSLWRNLKDELFGMETTLRFVEDLSEVEIKGEDAVDDLRTIYERLGKSAEYLPPVTLELAEAWCRDVEKVRPH